jgi:membrane protease YdiL (CAAX protease family)
VKRRPLSIFFIAAFILPWFVWGTTIAQNAGLIGWHVPQPLAFWVGLPVATYTTAALTGGWPAVTDLLRRLVRVKVNWLWYVVAIGLPIAMGATLVGLGLLIGSPAQVGVLVPVGALVGVLVLNTWEWLITEETAWRGYALPRLQRRFDPLTASLLLGLVWGLWHLPLFFIPDSFQSSVPFVGFLISTLATSVVIGWVFNRARGSVLIVALFHGFTDVVIAFTGVMTSGLSLFWLTVAFQMLVATACAGDLYRRDRNAPGLPAGTV